MTTDQVTYTFEIGYTSSRPIRVDEHTAWVTVEGDDSNTGYLNARWTAQAMVLGSRQSEMVTSTRLLFAEI